MKNKKIILFLTALLAFLALFFNFSVSAETSFIQPSSENKLVQKNKNEGVYGTQGEATNKTPNKKAEENKNKKEKGEKDRQKREEAEKKLKEETERSKKRIVRQGGQLLKGEEYPLDNYIGVSTDAKLNPIDGAIVGVSNGIFSITKLIYSGIDMSLNTLSSKEIVKEQSPKIEAVSRSMWSSLSTTFAITFIALSALVALYILSIKSDFTSAIMTILKTAIVFVIAGVWFAKASVFIGMFDNVSNQVQSSILSAGTSLITTENDIPEGQETQATTAVLRNSLFNTTVYRPYLLMNWGTVNEGEIKKKYGEMDRLTEIKKGSKLKDDLDSYVKTQVNEKGNSYMDWQGSGVYNKLGIAVISLFVVLLFGIPLLLISLSNLLVQFMILAVGLLLPVAFLISLIPKFGNGAYTVFEKLLFLFLSKSFISLFVLFILLITVLTDSVVPLTNSGSYMLNSALLIIVLNMLLVKRHEIISIITAGRVNVSDGGATRGLKGSAFGGLLAVGGMAKATKTAKRVATSPIRGVGAINRGVRGTQNTLNTLSTLRNLGGKGKNGTKNPTGYKKNNPNTPPTPPSETPENPNPNKGQTPNTTRPNNLSEKRNFPPRSDKKSGTKPSNPRGTRPQSKQNKPTSQKNPNNPKTSRELPPKRENEARPQKNKSSKMSSPKKEDKPQNKRALPQEKTRPKA